MDNSIISSKIKEFRSFMDKTTNSNVKQLLIRLDKCHYAAEYEDLRKMVKQVYEAGEMAELEYHGFEMLIQNIIADKCVHDEVFNNIKGDMVLVNDFKKRIWTESDISKVIQVRNTVTDLLTLDFISLDEYIELSNEVDRYIQYTLSNGGIK